MKYFDITIGTATDKFRDEATTILSDDDRVKDFFKPLPANHRLEFTADGLPLIVEIPPLTQAELDAKIAAQALAAKWADIKSQISSLKIGYLDGNTFVAKFGYEIDGKPADDTGLYDVSSAPVAVDVNAHVYNASAEGLRAMIEQATILAPETTINWYEDWQTFTADKVCLDVVAARARQEQQLIYDTVMGV